MRTIVIRGVDCTLFEKTTGILQIVPPFGPYTPVTAIYNPEIATAKEEALKALIKRAVLEWVGIERFNV
jgi:hypothetical protein